MTEQERIYRLRGVLVSLLSALRLQDLTDEERQEWQREIEDALRNDDCYQKQVEAA